MKVMILLAACMISSTIKGDYGWAVAFQGVMILMAILEAIEAITEAVKYRNK